MPLNRPAHSARNNRLLSRSLTLLTIVAGMLVCVAVAALHLTQESALDEAQNAIAELRRSRIDLYEGYMHVVVNELGRSAYERQDGLALAEQSMRDITARLPTARLQAPSEDYAAVMAHFVAALKKAAVNGDSKDKQEAETAFHGVEAILIELDTATRDDLTAISRRQDDYFTIALSVAVALMALICLGTALALRRQRRAERELDAAMHRAMLDAERFTKIFDATPSPICVIAMDDNVYLAANNAYLVLYGYSREELVGHNVETIGIWAKPEQRREYIQKLNSDKRVIGFEVQIRTRSGELREALVSSELIEFAGRECLLAALTDITERKRYEAHIERLANHDLLTGLPNRNLILDRTAQSITRARRDERHIAIMRIGLDRFKAVNTAYGHDRGDDLLKAVSGRLSQLLREGDTVARDGGDEFLLLFGDLASSADAFTILKKIEAGFEMPFIVGDQAVRIHASIGICLFPSNGEDAETLINNAETAMRRAKENGGGYQFFASGMDDEARGRAAMETRLREALTNGEFSLVYQPKVSIPDGAVIGCEALLRWTHPKLGAISPGRFIPIAEESGLILQLGDWVLREACRQGQAWRAAGLPSLTVGVNISARQFLQPDLAAWVFERLQESGLPAEYLELELTESAIANDAEKVIETMRRLKARGIHISIDDFGTGYSSLSYLRRFRADTLKVDQSFVRGMLDDPSDASIIAAVIALAHSQGMTAIAEGVESVAQYEKLRQMGCDQIQGYVFSPPVSAAAFAQLLRRDLRAVG